MIYFGITLRSKAASNDWLKVQKTFNRTLQSVYKQTSDSFKVIVACHDMPVLLNKYDERVEFLTAEVPIPTNTHEMMLDKGWKLSMIARKVRELGGGYVMIVDADDLISNRIAEYVEKHPYENGFLSKYGFIYAEGSRYAKRICNPYRICGSCSIVNYRPEDLPEEMPYDLWDDSLKDNWIIRKSHRIIPECLEREGRKLAKLPFPSTVYIRYTGDNHSMSGGNDLGIKRKAELFFRKRIPVNELEEEFNLKPLDNYEIMCD